MAFLCFSVVSSLFVGVALKHGDATRDLSQEIHALDKLRGGVSYNAVALSSPSVSQQYICSKVCPGRNTHKTRCVLVG